MDAEAEYADRKRRYAELSKLLDEWSHDPDGFDDEVWESLKAAIESNRMSYRKRFSDERNGGGSE